MKTESRIVNKFKKSMGNCKSKKDYKKLCKKMLNQIEAMDCTSDYMRTILSEIIGEDNYYNLLSVALQAYVAKSKGYDIHLETIHLDDYIENIFD